MSDPLHNDSKFTGCSTHYDTAVQEGIATLNLQGHRIHILENRLSSTSEKCELLKQKSAQQIRQLQMIEQNLAQLQGTPPTLEQHVWSMIIHAVRHPLTLIFLSCVLIYRLRTSTMV